MRQNKKTGRNYTGVQVGSGLKLGAWNDGRKFDGLKGSLPYSGFGAEVVILNIRWRVKLGVGRNGERDDDDSKKESFLGILSFFWIQKGIPLESYF